MRRPAVVGAELWHLGSAAFFLEKAETAGGVRSGSGFFVFGHRSVLFDRAVRFLWGVYCRRRRGLCVRVSDDGGRSDCGVAEK